MKYLSVSCAWAIPLCAFAAIAVAAPTDDASIAERSLDEVVVVANRAPEPLSKIGNSVTVLNDAAIKERQALLVSDLLAQTPGISIARNGGIGQPTSAFIRGAESDQTVVLIDGVQLNDPSLPGGGFNFANLMTSAVSRIEILRGAQSTLYGSQAIGGVINITTADPGDSTRSEVTVEGGSHDTGYGTVGVGGRGDALQWRLAGNWFGTSGIDSFDERYGGKHPDAAQIGGGSGQLRYEITPDLKLDLRAYYTQARTDFAGFDTPKGTFGDDSEFARNSQFLGYGGLTLQSADHALTNRVAFQYTASDTENYDPQAPQNYGSATTKTFYGIGRNQREEYQGTWALTRSLQAVFGAQHERSTISTDSPAFDVVPMPLRKNVNLDSGYVQLQDEVLPGVTLTAGGRYDEHDVYGGHSTGQAAAAWKTNDGNTIVRASYGQGFKAPSLYQLYSAYGNLALRPEQAASWDAGIERRSVEGHWSGSATYFERHSRELIQFFDCFAAPGPLCATEPFGYYANIARASARGAELEGTVTARDEITLAANYSFTKTEDRSPQSSSFGRELPRRPKQAANLLATYHAPFSLTTNLAIRYGGRSFDDAANDIPLGGYVLVDVRTAFKLKDVCELYARLENIADKHYETAYRYGTLGRVVYAGVRARF